MIDGLLDALSMAFAMGWEILWPLILGFALSAVVQAVVSHREMSRLLPDDRPRSIATALLLGAASSSCSYAAVALARSLFRKGANFTAAMAFEFLGFCLSRCSRLRWKRCAISSPVLGSGWQRNARKPRGCRNSSARLKGQSQNQQKSLMLVQLHLR
jgi:hypothetical protein